MIANDELKIYICNKYGCDCDECSAGMYNKYDDNQCAFDMIDECLAEYDLDEYYKEKQDGGLKMKIKEITSEAIIFDNGSSITYSHEQDCCEHNYADFSQLDDLGKDYEYDIDLKFEVVDGVGFRFGDKNRMFFIPCYSVQNGYYSDEVDIYYNNRQVLRVNGELRYY